MKPKQHAAPFLRTHSNAYRGYVLTILFLVSVSNYIDRFILSILLEPIKLEFDLTDSQMGLLSGTAFALFYATLGVPIARIADRSNRKNIIAIAMLVWSMMTVLCGYAANFGQLFLARVGVGIGEAGGAAPSQSLLSDYFRPSERARALAVFSLGSPVGLIIALIGGGYLATEYNWRIALIIIGAPGIVLSLILFLTVREPRHSSNNLIKNPLSLQRTFKELWNNRTYRYVVTAFVFGSVVSYGMIQWFPTFIVRTHDKTLVEVGAVYGIVVALAAFIGIPVGGFVSDLLAKRDIRWLVWIPAILYAGCTPLALTALFTPNFTLMMALVFVQNLLLQLVVGAQFSALISAIDPRYRTLGLAVCYMFANLIGLGLGPTMVGILSDLFSLGFGDRALQYALAVSLFALPPTGVFFFLAGKHFPQVVLD